MRSLANAWLRSQSSEGLTGLVGSMSKMAHSQSWQVNAGCWQEASVSHHMGLLVELLECLHNMVTGFPSCSL